MKPQEFTIKDLESFSGVKAHTIRIWEQRYGLLAPDRTDTNIRRYNDKDLKRLLNISLLNNLGYKISAISKMSDQQMADAIAQHNSEAFTELHTVNSLKVAMLNYDEQQFHSIVDPYIESNGLEATYKEVLMPFMHEIGLLWQTDAICPAHEHFISNLVRSKLISHVAKLPVQTDLPGARTFVLYLPDLEIHELSLIMVNYLLRKSGHKTIFLGVSVPFDDLLQINQRLGDVEYISIFTTNPPAVLLPDYLKRISTQFEQTNCHFHLTGFVLRGVKSPDNRFITVYQDLQSMMQELKLA